MTKRKQINYKLWEYLAPQIHMNHDTFIVKNELWIYLWCNLGDKLTNNDFMIRYLRDLEYDD